MNALDAAIYTKLSGDTGSGGLMTIVTGVFNRVAPEGQAFPYVVWQTVSGVDNYTLTKRAKSRFVIQLKALDKGDSGKVAGQAMDRIDALLNDAALTVTGFSLLVIRREMNIQSVEVDEGVEYPVEISHYGVELTQ